MAQEAERSSSTLTAIITGPVDIPVKRKIILDASASHLVGNNVEYAWYANDGTEPISRTVDVIYTPEQAGELRFRLVIRSRVNDATVEDTAMHTVTVYRRKIALVADATVTDATIAELKKTANETSTYLRVLHTALPATSRGGEEALGNLLTEQSTALIDAEAIVVWTDGLPIPGLQALMRTMGDKAREEAALREQTLLLITDRSLTAAARVTKGPASILRPRAVLVARPDMISSLLRAENMQKFREQTAKESTSSAPLLLDASTVRVPSWNILTALIGYMLTLGVSGQTILLLLMLPVIATILAFLKQVVGVTTFGLFAPAIISLSFLALGWWVGVLSLLFILATGYFARASMKNLHILYIPKMAIVLGVGSFSLLLLVAIGTMLRIPFSHDTVFVLLIMSTLTENFLNVKSEQGLLSALLAIGQTVLAALLCVFIVRWPPFESLILSYPEWILLTPFVNILFGRWTGLRFTEYFRFRSVFKHLREE